jgi:hypothetical protein
VTRETAASSAGPGHDRPERARACLLVGEPGAAAAADHAHDRPRPDETSRVIDRADRPHAPAAGSGPAGSPGPAHARDTAGPAPWLPPCQAPGNGADVTGLARMTRWTRDRHRRRYAAAGPGAVRVSDRPGGGPVPGPARASAPTARTPAGRADGTSTPGDSTRQPLSDQERAAIRQAGADDARRSRAGQGFPERIEDPAAVAVLAALLRDARPPPRNETGRRTTRPAA